MPSTDFLLQWQFWSLELGLLVLAVTTVRAIPDLLGALRLDPPQWIAAIVLSIAAVVVVRAVPAPTNRIYYDEHIYQSIGQNLSDLRRAQVCLFGNAEGGRLECFAGEYNKQPYAYPHLLSAGYRLFGVSDTLAHHLNSLVFGLTVLLLFLLVVVLFDDALAAWFAGLMLMLTPEALRWSATAAAEPSAALFALMAILAAAATARTGSKALFAWTVAATAYAVQFRPESALVVPVVGFLVLRRGTARLGVPTLAAGAVAGFALTALHLAHLMAMRNEGWGTTGERLSLEFLPHNLPVNGAFYLWDARFPVWYTILALVGLIAGKGHSWSRAILALHFTLFWGIFLLFYAGSYNYGADVRYALTTFVPLMALAGVGVSTSIDALGRIGSRATLAAAALVLLVMGFSWYAPYVRAVDDGAWGARADVQFARDVVATLPANSLILTHNPNMFQLWGRNAGQLSIASPDERVMAAWRARYGDRIYLHWNFWCNVDDPAQQQFCRDTLAQFPTELVAERVERNYRFAFYRIR